jgi:hypothetical protein
MKSKSGNELNRFSGIERPGRPGRSKLVIQYRVYQSAVIQLAAWRK